jgi:hypothetical protein
MESKTRTPGGPTGTEAVLQEEFGVPARPTMSRADAARLISTKIRSENIRCEAFEVSDQPVTRGALFDARGVRVTFPEGSSFDYCYVALVNPDVSARWGHPAHWAFVPVEGENEIVLQPTNSPEQQAGPVRLLKTGDGI